MENVDEIIFNASRCLLPKLSKCYDEKSDHVEYSIRNNNLHQNYRLLHRGIIDFNILKSEGATSITSHLLNLYLELICDCPWNDIKSKECADKLEDYFDISYGIHLDKVLWPNDYFNSQAIFYKCIEDLHKKLTFDDFKKYPGQVEVYCLIIKDIKNYRFSINPLKVMPVAQILADDYIDSNKVKGLTCCLSILQCLTSADFDSGNYYEVIYRTLMKSFTDKDLEVTKLNHSCLLELCNILPSNEKDKKLEDLYNNILDNLYTESNIHRKSECLEFTRKIISLHKDNCIGKSNFKKIIIDNLDMCTDDGVAEILLEKTLQCLEEWIKYTWCAWYLPSDYKIISTLFKVLVSRKDESITKYIQKILVTLIILCDVSGKQKIKESIEKNIENVDDEIKTIFESIIKEIHDYS